MVSINKKIHSMKRKNRRRRVGELLPDIKHIVMHVGNTKQTIFGTYYCGKKVNKH